MSKGVGPKHTACHPGKEVIIKLRNGETIIDKFVERNGAGIIKLENYGRISKEEMRSFQVVRNKDKLR